jgi:hypothetical protein
MPQRVIENARPACIDGAQRDDDLCNDGMPVNGRHALGLKPALEAIDVLLPQMLGAIDRRCRLGEKVEEALQSIEVLQHS